jgi:hypothetical protein
VAIEALPKARRRLKYLVPKRVGMRNGQPILRVCVSVGDCKVVFSVKFGLVC